MPIVVYRDTDRVQIKIHDVTLTIKPLRYRDKMDVSSAIANEGGSQRENAMLGLTKLIKYSLKDIDGVIYPDGSKFELIFDESSNLSDESIDELLNMEIAPDLTTAFYAMMSGIPKEITGHDGKAIEHIKIVPLPGIPKKK